MQTSSNSNGVQGVLSDIFDLCELQWQLMTVDWHESKRRTINAAVFLASASCIALTALLSATIGAGWLLHERSGIPVGLAFLILSGIALLLASIAGFIGWRLFLKASESFSESGREDAENVRWMKRVVLQPKSSARNQLRHGTFSPQHIDQDHYTDS